MSINENEIPKVTWGGSGPDYSSMTREQLLDSVIPQLLSSIDRLLLRVHELEEKKS